MNIRTLAALANKAKDVIDERGGTDRLKADAERLRAIATGPGTPQEKAKAAGDALKEKSAPPAPAEETVPAEEAAPTAAAEEAAPVPPAEPPASADPPVS